MHSRVNIVPNMSKPHLFWNISIDKYWKPAYFLYGEPNDLFYFLTNKFASQRPKRIGKLVFRCAIIQTNAKVNLSFVLVMDFKRALAHLNIFNDFSSVKITFNLRFLLLKGNISFLVEKLCPKVHA